MSSRRLFIKRAACGLGIGWLGYEGAEQFVFGHPSTAHSLGFRGDAPRDLDRFSCRASHYESHGQDVQCLLCPHQCLLADGDRGFCRARVVKGHQLFSVAYGNLCSVAVDPIEKKPLYHYLPQTQILSVALGGCNLRCRNCQNWQISQARPEDVVRFDLMPQALVALARENGTPAVAYTYTEPLVAYEYVRDAAQEARAQNIKNVLVTAGYINEKPLRELCRVVDAVTLDVKGFKDRPYRQDSGARLAPVLRSLEVVREENVWLEVSFLMVPTLTDDPLEIGEFSRWVVGSLGAETPLHILRFHPAHRLTHLQPTPLQAMQRAREAAKKEGLAHVYLGNVPGRQAASTTCPQDGEVLIEREGFRVLRSNLRNGACPSCGRPLVGVFSL